MSNSYEALKSARSQLKYKFDRIKLYGDRTTKTDTLELIESVLSDLDLVDLDSMHDECYSADHVDELVEQQLEERERQRLADLSRRDPEENRERFKVIMGGAA